MAKAIRRRTPADRKPPIAVDQDALCVLKVPEGGGTGFVFLKPAWVLTAKHVVIRENGTIRPVTALFHSGPIEARLRFAHPHVDLAVLELQRLGRCRAPLLPGDREISAGGLLCVGYQPSVSDRAEGRYTSFVSAVPKYERREIIRDGYEEIQLTFPAPHGEQGPSGGPVLGHGGAVVAVVIDGIDRKGTPYMRATSVSAVLDYLTFP